MRYVVALVVAVLIIASGALYVRSTEQAIAQRMRQDVRAAQAAGEIPADVNPDAVDLSDFGMELTSAEMNRLMIAQVLGLYWYVFAGLVLAICFGVAYFTAGAPKVVE